MPELALAPPPVVRKEETLPLTPRPQRNQMLDAARGLACIGVIWMHTVIDSPDLARAASLTRFGTPFFVLAAIFFLLTGLSTKASAGWGSYALQRFRRLYIPFLVWSLIYLLLRTGKRSLLTTDGPVHLGMPRLLLGTARHLWFLAVHPDGVHCGLSAAIRFTLAALGQNRAGHRLPRRWDVAARIRCPDIRSIEPYIGKWYMNAWMFVPGVSWGIALAAIYPLLPRTLKGTPLIAVVG